MRRFIKVTKQFPEYSGRTLRQYKNCLHT